MEDRSTRDDEAIQRFKNSKKKKAKTPKRSNGIADDADHYVIATSFVDAIVTRTGQRPVYSQGSLWRADSGIWKASTADVVAVEIGALYGGFDYCRRGADFRSIARIVAGITECDDFFQKAPVGIAAGSRFWRVQDGKIIPEDLTPVHRQCMRLPAEPDFDAKTPLWTGLLDHAFGDDVGQRDLLQVLFGSALVRALWLQRIAVLLFGKTTTGKTTLLNVLAAMFPHDLVSATNPQRWGNEYYRAGLAGKALNIVGELDATEPIPGGAFKSVVGCDVIEGRHPTHRPFSFVCTAGHFFNANRMPPTLDRSDAFFKRWRIIEFNNIVPDDQLIDKLADRIVAEEQAGVLAWMLEGGAMLQVGGIPQTPQHRRLVEKWRVANNSALLFLLDATVCELNPQAEVKGEFLYDAYRPWAMANGLGVFGRNGFFEAIEDGAGRIGVQRVDHGGVAYFRGVRLR